MCYYFAGSMLYIKNYSYFELVYSIIQTKTNECINITHTSMHRTSYMLKLMFIWFWLNNLYVLYLTTMLLPSLAYFLVHMHTHTEADTNAHMNTWADSKPDYDPCYEINCFYCCEVLFLWPYGRNNCYNWNFDLWLQIIYKNMWYIKSTNICIHKQSIILAIL